MHILVGHWTHAMVLVEEEGLEKYQMGLILLVVHPTHQSQGGGQERDLIMISWNLFQKDQGADRENIRCHLLNWKIHPKIVDVRLSFFLTLLPLQQVFQMTFHWLMSCQRQSQRNQLQK